MGTVRTPWASTVLSTAQPAAVSRSFIVEGTEERNRERERKNGGEFLSGRKSKEEGKS